MTTITAKMVSELRDKTNATMDICKLALVRTNGDIEAAEETIRINSRSLTNNNEITTLRQRVAELEKERDEEIARNRPLRNLIASLEEQKSHWNKKRNENREAVSTLDSEREANALLTAERDKAAQYWQIAEGRCDALKQQIDDLVAAISIAEPVMDAHAGPSRLADFRAAIASVKEKQNAANR